MLFGKISPVKKMVVPLHLISDNIIFVYGKALGWGHSQNKGPRMMRS